MIYMNFGAYGADVHIPLYIFCLLLKKKKSKRAWPILKSNSTSFWLKFFFQGCIIQILGKGGLKGHTLISSQSEYSSSN